MQPKVNILFIEDEQNILTFVTKLLYGHNYKVTTAITGTEGLQLINSICPDLILLDLGLPDMDGQTIIRQVREWSDCPIIVISARTNEHEKVKALDLGADDYMTKPFLMQELLLRISDILRRAYRGQLQRETALQLGERTVELSDATVSSAGGTVTLTATERAILQKLLDNRGHIVTYDALCEAVWGSDYYGCENSLNVHIRHLREKVEAQPSQPAWILTARGLGYKLAKEGTK